LGELSYASVDTFEQVRSSPIWPAGRCRCWLARCGLRPKLRRPRSSPTDHCGHGARQCAFCSEIGLLEARTTADRTTADRIAADRRVAPYPQFDSHQCRSRAVPPFGWTFLAPTVSPSRARTGDRRAYHCSACPANPRALEPPAAAPISPPVAAASAAVATSWPLSLSCGWYLPHSHCGMLHSGTLSTAPGSSTDTRWGKSMS